MPQGISPAHHPRRVAFLLLKTVGKEHQPRPSRHHENREPKNGLDIQMTHGPFRAILAQSVARVCIIFDCPYAIESCHLQAECLTATSSAKF